MTPLELVKKACVKANSEIVTDPLAKNMHSLNGIFQRPIRLADVLLAIPKKTRAVMLDKYAEERQENDVFNAIIRRWNLRNDSLDAQTPATIEFLSTLLA